MPSQLRSSPLGGNDPVLGSAPATIRDRLKIIKARVRDLRSERAELVKERDAARDAFAAALAATLVGLDRHHRRARYRLVERLLEACTPRDKLAALDAYAAAQEEIERAQR